MADPVWAFREKDRDRNKEVMKMKKRNFFIKLRSPINYFTKKKKLRKVNFK
jgi:hypothetical protein